MMGKKKIDYLGYDPATIDAWRDVLLKAIKCGNEHEDIEPLFDFLMTIRKRHRRVVAAMMTLVRWIHIDDKEMHYCQCPLCAVSSLRSYGEIDTSCDVCPFKEKFGQGASCIDSVEDGKADLKTRSEVNR